MDISEVASKDATLRSWHPVWSDGYHVAMIEGM